MIAERVLTPDLMYRAALGVAIADLVFAALLTRRVGASGLRRAKATVVIVAGIFWFGVWMTVHALYWEPVYSHVFPAWSRWIVPPVYGLCFAGVAAWWRWLALRTGRLAVPVFIALWGATGALTHAYAIYGRGLLANAPMLQHLTPLSAIVFATCEFGFYGCVMLTAAAILRGRLDRRARPAASPDPAR